MGLVKMSKQRKKELTIMRLKSEQDIYDLDNNNKYCDILKLVEDENTLNTYWVKAKNIKHLSRESNYWKLDKLKKVFLLSNDELKLIGGGSYTYEMGKWYLIHSKYFIQIWFSLFPEYEKYLLIRKIKPRLTRDWDKHHGVVRGSKKTRVETTDDLEYIEKGKKWSSKFHSVLIGERSEIDQIINDTNLDIPKSVLKIHYGCTCVHGSRTICADSHGICALRYIRALILGIDIKTLDEKILAKKKWNKVLDINFFKAYLKDLKVEQLQLYINKFIKKRNYIKPLYSLDN